MGQAMEIASKFDVSPELFASDGQSGMLELCVPSLTVSGTKSGIDAFAGDLCLEVDWTSIVIRSDAMDDQYLPVINITIATMES